MTKQLRLWKHLGNAIADNWGPLSELGFDEHVKSLTTQDLHTCLLAAAVTQLTALTNEIHELRIKKPPCDPSVGVSMGMLKGLLATVPPPPGTFLKWLPKDGLGSRARRALIRSGVKVLEDLTCDSLIGIHGCGAATRNEILDWADQQREHILLAEQEPDNATDATEHNDATGTPGGSGVAPENGEETHATRTRHSAEGHDAGGTGFTPQASDPIHPCVPD